MNHSFNGMVGGKLEESDVKVLRIMEIFGYDSPFLFSVFSNQPFFDIYSLEV